jgi:hypothetical protein
VRTTEGIGADSGTGGEGEGAGDASGSGVDGSGNVPDTGDISTLFTPEEITAQRERVSANQAEDTRRATMTEEQRTEEDKVKAGEAEKNQAPAEYAEFTAPEGVVLDSEIVNEFKALAKEKGYTQADAQGLVDIASKTVQRVMDGIFTAHEERKTSWLEAAKNDPEIGADVKKWDPANPQSSADSVALRAFNTLAAGAPGLKQMVDEIGIGNHPEFIRVMYRIGMRMREDGFESQGTGGGASTVSTAKSLWPDMK